MAKGPFATHRLNRGILNISAEAGGWGREGRLILPILCFMSVFSQVELTLNVTEGNLQNPAEYRGGS